MKSPKPPFVKLKSVTILIVVAGLILIGGFIATKTLLLDDHTKQTPLGGGVQASSGDRSVSGNPDAPGVSYATPVGSPRSPADTSGNPNASVWVNTTSGVYHCPNTRWYGNTKNGKYMTQQEAQSKGYRPAYGTACG